MTRILIDNAVTDIGANLGFRQMDKLFADIDSGMDEQAAYFPFNPKNPIYRAHGIYPIVTAAALPGGGSCGMCIVNGYLANGGNNVLNIEVLFTIGAGGGRMNILVCEVNNKDADKESKYTSAGARFMNTLQNFLIFSANPGRITLYASDQGTYYWANWFDFEKNGDCAFLNGYREKFADVLGRHKVDGYNIPPRAEILRAVSGFRHPIQFKTVGDALGLSEKIGNKHIGQIGMYKAWGWDGQCGPCEMDERSVVRQKGLEYLAARGVRLDYPPAFRKRLANIKAR